MSDAFVVTGIIPGFRVGEVVDLKDRRAAFYLSDADLAVLEEHRGSLSPLSPPEAAGSGPSNLGAPGAPRAAG